MLFFSRSIQFSEQLFMRDCSLGSLELKKNNLHPSSGKTIPEDGYDMGPLKIWVSYRSSGFTSKLSMF